MTKRHEHLSPFLKKLARGRKVTRFADLPLACRYAYGYFLGEIEQMSRHGADTGVYGVLVRDWAFPERMDILYKLPERDGISAWMRGFRTYVRKHLTMEHADHLVGHCHLRLSPLVEEARIRWTDWPDDMGEKPYAPKHPIQEVVRRWPVLLCEASGGGPLRDGWHRLARYDELGYLKIPALYFVEQ